MPRSLNKLVRRLHRLLGILLVLMTALAVLAQDPAYRAIVQQLQPLILPFMGLTGAYLFILPWWARWRRQLRERQAKLT